MLAAVKTRIVAQILTVSGIDKVYNRMRNLADDSVKKDELSDTDGRIHVWMVTRESSRWQDLAQNQVTNQRRDQLVIHGFYAVRDSDDSEAAFDALIESVMTAINADRRASSKLGDTVANGEPPSLRLQDHRMYANTLCHHAEIVLPVDFDITT